MCTNKKIQLVSNIYICARYGIVCVCACVCNNIKAPDTRFVIWERSARHKDNLKSYTHAQKETRLTFFLCTHEQKKKKHIHIKWSWIQDLFYHFHVPKRYPPPCAHPFCTSIHITWGKDIRPGQLKQISYTTTSFFLFCWWCDGKCKVAILCLGYLLACVRQTEGYTRRTPFCHVNQSTNFIPNSNKYSPCFHHFAQDGGYDIVLVCVFSLSARYTQYASWIIMCHHAGNKINHSILH